jgi:hypothetical protein
VIRQKLTFEAIEPGEREPAKPIVSFRLSMDRVSLPSELGAAPRGDGQGWVLKRGISAKDLHIAAKLRPQELNALNGSTQCRMLIEPGGCLQFVA